MRSLWLLGHGVLSFLLPPTDWLIPLSIKLLYGSAYVGTLAGPTLRIFERLHIKMAVVISYNAVADHVVSGVVPILPLSQED